MGIEKRRTELLYDLLSMGESLNPPCLSLHHLR